MSSQQCEPGEGWDKAFRRAIVAGGPLKGARFTDVGWNDLKKAAKQYKADPRFNQYAKRCLSERAFSSQADPSEKAAESNCCKRRCSQFGQKPGAWILAKAKVKLGLACILLLTALLLLSRPLFYVVICQICV